MLGCGSDYPPPIHWYSRCMWSFPYGPMMGSGVPPCDTMTLPTCSAASLAPPLLTILSQPPKWSPHCTESIKSTRGQSWQGWARSSMKVSSNPIKWVNMCHMSQLQAYFACVLFLIPSSEATPARYRQSKTRSCGRVCILDRGGNGQGRKIVWGKWRRHQPSKNIGRESQIPCWDPP